MDKKKIFINLLKTYGVTEYWCDPFFDPSKEHPNARVLLPIMNADLNEAVADLYNDYKDDEKSLLVVSRAVPEDKYFKSKTKGMERRLVN